MICKAGEKAVVRYKFPEKNGAAYSTKNTPIEVIARPITAKHYVFTGYYPEYWIDDYDPSTGELEQSIEIKHPASGYYINYEGIVYPPFEYPLMQWEGPTGFDYQSGEGQVNYCRNQWFSIGIKYSDEKGVRKHGFFNLIGSRTNVSRQSDKCFISSVVRDVRFRRVDNKTDPLKWEINIIDSKGNKFADYGLQEPTYTCECGDCAEGYIKCDSYKYPGYQCIPCSQFKSEIAAMRSMIRRING